jgi:hypothetical protein
VVTNVLSHVRSVHMTRSGRVRAAASTTARESAHWGTTHRESGEWRCLSCLLSVVCCMLSLCLCVCVSVCLCVCVFVCLCVCCLLSIVCCRGTRRLYCVLSVVLCMRPFFRPITAVLCVAHPRETAPNTTAHGTAWFPTSPRVVANITMPRLTFVARHATAGTAAGMPVPAGTSASGGSPVCDSVQRKEKKTKIKKYSRLAMNNSVLLVHRPSQSGENTENHS